MEPAYKEMETPATDSFKIVPPSGIYITKVEGKGVGVFAREGFKKGAIIEECPVRKVSKAEDEMIRKNTSVMRQYLYVWDEHSEEEAGAVVFGYGFLYNHSSKPNMIWDDSTPGVLRFIASKDIAKDEELTFEYGVPLWFAPVE